MAIISDLTDQEKSVLLAKVMGWTVGTWEIQDANGQDIYPVTYQAIPDKDGGRSTVDFYDPVNMALAWRVLNQFYEDTFVKSFPAGVGWWKMFGSWWRLVDPPIWSRPNAQHFWLDKVLELAIEAGIVEEE